MFKFFAVVVGIVFMGYMMIGAGLMESEKGSGKLISESRMVSNFDRIVLAVSGDVIIHQGEEESLSIKTDENIMAHIITEVKNKTLYLEHADNIRNINPTRLIFTLHLKKLSGVEISGSGDVMSKNIVSEDLELAINGSGDMQFDSLKAKAVDVLISGSGDVELRGTAASQNIKIHGSGDFTGGDLRGETVNVRINGSGDAVVWATEELNVHNSGSSSVEYYGNPNVEFTNNGSGDIKNRKR